MMILDVKARQFNGSKYYIVGDSADRDSLDSVCDGERVVGLPVGEDFGVMVETIVIIVTVVTVVTVVKVVTAGCNDSKLGQKIGFDS